MSSLYTLTGERLALQNMLEANGYDELTIIDTLQGESAEIEAKIQDYGFLIRNRNAFADSIDAEIVKLTERAMTERARVKAIEDNLLRSMIACGFKKIEAPNFTISVKENPVKVDVLDESQIPPEFMRTPQPKPLVAAPDKKSIKEAIEAGKEVAGCRLIRESKLVIK
jgi:hypothetical protein